MIDSLENIPSRESLRVVKATSVLPPSEGIQFYMEILNGTGEIFPIFLESRPSKKIKDWSPEDKMIVNTVNGSYVLQCHENKGPKFLVIPSIGDNGKPKDYRATFFSNDVSETGSEPKVRKVREPKPETASEGERPRRMSGMNDMSVSVTTKKIIDAAVPPVQSPDESHSHFRKRMRKFVNDLGRAVDAS